MNGMILQTPTESKDIKLSSKKSLDTKSEKGENLFENLIAKLVDEEGENKNSHFLLGKLLNLSGEFANKGKILSEFSKDDLITSEEEASLLSLEDLFKVALALKNGESFSTPTPEIKTLLQDKDIVSQLKEAKNIKELLNIADKNGIKVKNFEFLNPDAPLDVKDKKLVQKITSEEIFKMIEPKSALKEAPLTQSVLSKIINNEVKKEKTGKSEQANTLTSLLAKENIKKKDITPIAQEQKASLVKSETPKTPTALKIQETEAESTIIKKPQKLQQHTLSSLLKDETVSKALKSQQQIVSEEPILKTDTETKESTTDKTAQVTDIKSESIQKVKDTPDVKKTFNTFAMEFKEKVEAYKPPMMKINMQLSPGTLGDVDVTLVSRGNNLQVNINSNTNALALFVQNQAEFKNSLVNMGFSDLQMNFGDRRGEERGQQQQHKEDNQASNYHDSLENEEVEGLNIILPNYV